MSKSFRRQVEVPIVIDEDDLPKRRGSWGNVRPYTRIEVDRKKDKQLRECRGRKFRIEDDE